MATFYSQSSFDGWAPELMDELVASRSPMRAAYDAVWRKERLLRYVYWLEHEQHPPFNLVGSWTNDDIRAEIELWQGIRKRALDDADAEQELTGLLERKFDCSFSEALARGTWPELATFNLPIWNAETGSLVPQQLGNCVLYRTADCESQSPGLGRSYGYKRPDSIESLTLYIYHKNFQGLMSGIRDQRIHEELRQSFVEAHQMAQDKSKIIGKDTGPLVETVKSHHDQEIQCLGVGYPVLSRGDVQEWSAISLTGFRGFFLKIRYTAPLHFVSQ